MDLVLLGKIVGTHGIKGEVKILSNSDFKNIRFKVGNVLYIKKGQDYLPIIIDSYRVHKGLDLIKFNRYENINDVLKFINLDLYTEYTDVELKDDEYHHIDLLKCLVYDTDNNFIGSVKGLRELPQGLLLEILKTDEKVSLVPFNKEFVISVDIDLKTIVIDPIEGLL